MNVHDLFDLNEKVVLLIGASGVLGVQYAEALCQAGASIVLSDKNYDKCKQLEKNLKKKYSNPLLSIKVDVTNQSSVQDMVKKTLQKFSKIDILVNNAIFPEGKKERSYSFEKFPLSLWNKIFSVNITGLLICCQEVGKIMTKQKTGNIINVGSIYGLVAPDQRIYGKSGVNSTIAYATTKSAILNFTRYLASYWHDKGIRVNTLTLGGVKMDQSPDFVKSYSYKTIVGRMAEKDEYVGALLFLASDASKYMTGSNLVIDGGWTAW